MKVWYNPYNSPYKLSTIKMWSKRTDFLITIKTYIYYYNSFVFSRNTCNVHNNHYFNVENSLAEITLSIISQKSICFESLAASTCTINVNFPQEASQLKELVGVV